MLYTSLENSKIKELKKLHLKKYRDKKNLFLVEGTHLVLEAFKTGYLEELIIEKNELFPLPVPTSYVTNDIIHYLSTLETPSGVMAVCRKKPQSIEPGNKVLFLDNIQDPGNLGTIIRSAVAFNIDTIILYKGVDLYNSKVIRATQGLFFHINVLIVDDFKKLNELKENGHHIYGTKVTHGKSIKSLEKCEKFVIIVGNEGSGISEDVANICDSFIYIPMSGVCESLNVGVATSIILYELDK